MRTKNNDIDSKLGEIFKPIKIPDVYFCDILHTFILYASELSLDMIIFDEIHN